MAKILMAFLISVFVLSNQAFAHCQIPCGIYGDELRFDLIKEHLATVEKAMQQINTLPDQSPVNYNQIIRWTMAKEDHTAKIDEIITQYFLTQRIKLNVAGDTSEKEKYLRSLTLLHEMLVYSMKSKQTTDVSNIAKLRELTDAFYLVYFGADHKRHEHKE